MTLKAHPLVVANAIVDAFFESDRLPGASSRETLVSRIADAIEGRPIQLLVRATSRDEFPPTPTQILETLRKSGEQPEAIVALGAVQKAAYVPPAAKTRPIPPSMIDLNNTVELPSYVMAESKLQAGQYVYFVGQGDGKWEMVTEAVMDAYLAAVPSVGSTTR